MQRINSRTVKVAGQEIYIQSIKPVGRSEYGTYGAKRTILRRQDTPEIEMEFDSWSEATRWLVLRGHELRGDITDLQRQVTVLLHKPNGNKGRMIWDFQYQFDGATFREEHKSLQGFFNRKEFAVNYKIHQQQYPMIKTAISFGDVLTISMPPAPINVGVLWEKYQAQCWRNKKEPESMWDINSYQWECKS